MEIKISSYINKPNFTARSSKMLTEKMTSALQEAIQKGETVTSEELAKRLGASKDAVRGIIYRDKTSEVRHLFNQVKDPKGAKKVLSDRTIAQYCAAMTTAALAGIALEKNKPETYVGLDYTKTLAQNIEDMKLSDETKKVISAYLEQSPLFVDFLVNNKDKNGNRRRYCAGNVDMIYKAYTNNTEITEQLAKTYDEEGNFMYSTEQIYKLTDIHENCSDLYEMAQEQPDIIHKLYSYKDEKGRPRFGIADIKLLAEKSKKFPKYINYLLEEKDTSDRPRFNAEQIIFILNELEGEDPEFIVNLVKFKQKIYNEKGNYETAYPQTVKLSGKNIVDIIEMDKKYHVQDFVYNLMDVVGKYNITGDRFVKYTEWSTKSNVEFVRALQGEWYFQDNEYSLLEVAGRKLTKEEFEELKSQKRSYKSYYGTIIEKPSFDSWELKKIEQYVEK